MHIIRTTVIGRHIQRAMYAYIYMHLSDLREHTFNNEQAGINRDAKCNNNGHATSSRGLTATATQLQQRLQAKSLDRELLR